MENLNNINIKSENKFSTPNTYLAAAIIFETGKQPDKFIVCENNFSDTDRRSVKIFIEWEDRNKLPMDLVTSGDFQFNLYEYMKIHRKLMETILNIRNDKLTKMRSKDEQ